MVGARRFLPPSATVDLSDILDEPDDRLSAKLAGVSDLAIALDLPSVSPEDGARVLKVLPPNRAANVFERVTPAEAALLVPRLPPDLQVRVFRKLQRDEQADVVPLLDEDVRDDLLARLPIDVRRELKILLKYPEDHLASIMTVGVPTFREGWTVTEAITHLRTFASDSDVTVHYLYVVDEFERLVGVLSIRDLLNLKGEKRLGDAARRNLTVLQSTMDPEEAARTQQASAWRSLPVVDPDGRVVGVLTDEDASDYLALEDTEDFQRFGGMEPLESPYLRTGVVEFFRKRAGWLVILFVAQLTTTFILQHYQVAIETMVALSFFIPVLVATGGNVGSQSSSLLIRALALGEVKTSHAVAVAMKESTTGLILGLLMGTLAFFRVQATGGPTLLSIVVATSILIVCVMAALVGGVLPILVDRLGGDPAVMSAPFIMTLVDALGIMLYMGLAVAVLGLG